ncbi:retrovirus-related pol polyprotein from transposon TNT 1-94 [Tanacetum coccineum]
MTTLAEFMIIVGADNRPPMLEKSLYGSWKSRMELYIENRENVRIIFNSLQNGLLVWPTVVEDDDTTRTKKYEEPSIAEKIQAGCDLKDTNIVLQGLPSDVYVIVNHHKVSKDIWDRVKLLMQGIKLSLQEKECLAVLVFNQVDDLIACLNKAMGFLTAVASSSYKGNATSSGGNNAGGKARVVKCYNCQGKGHMARKCTQPKRPRNAAWFKEKVMLAEAQEAGQILDEEQLAFLADPAIPDGKAIQTTIPNTIDFQTEDLDAYDFDCDGVSNAKVVLMANLSNYGSDVISEVPHHEPYHTDTDNQSVHTIQGFEQTPVVDFTDNEITSDGNIIPYSQYFTLEKMIDSQMDDMIKEKLALKQQIDSLEQNLSNQIKEKEYLLQTFTIFKNESKEKESKYMDKEIDLEKKIKELDNIVYKVSQSAQTVHIVISSQHVASPVIDDEKTLILEELNRLSEDFCKHFVPQQELFDEQAFWLQTSHPNTDQSASSPVKNEAPKELPKVSLVNASLKKLKYHLGQFDTVVKKRITPDAITEGECGFEYTKAVFLKEIILFLKTLKDIFNVFDKDLLNELQSDESCVKCLNLDAELLKSQNTYNDLSKTYSQLEKHCISLELTMQLNQEFFQKDSLSNDQNALEILEYFENNDLKAQLQAKDTTICKLKQHIKSMRENVKEENVKHKMDEIENINIELEHRMFKLDIEPLSHRLKNNRDAHEDYLKKTIENTDTIRGLGSNATDVPSSSSLVNDRLSRLTSGIWTSDAQTYDRGNRFQLRTSRSKDTNLYTISLDDMLNTSPICLLSKASKTKSWLWHRQLSHINFACALGKSKKSFHQPKAEDTNQVKLYLLHMDLCSPMRVESINGKKYILVIVDDYSRFTWVKILRSKDEAPDAIIKCIKNIQVHLNVTVRKVRTYNGIEFVNQTLRDFYENVDISHQTSFARTPQQNSVVERQNQTLVEVAPTMLLFSKAPLSGLILNLIPQQPCNPPNRDDWNRLFQRMHKEYFNPPTISNSPVPVAIAPRAVDIADSPMSTSIDQDALSISIPSTQEQEHSLIISQGVEESPKTPHFHDGLLYESLHEDSTSQGSSSNVRPSHTLLEIISRWTKDHIIENVIGYPSRSVSTRKQPKTDAMWCYFDAFLTSIELKNFKQAMTEPSWINAMQEEIHKFERLQVWELVPCLDKVMLTKLKWIYKVKTDEFGGVLKNKA